MQNSLIIAGTLASDVSIETDPEGHHVARFRVVIHSRRKDPGSGLWTNLRPTVLPVMCRRRLADNVATTLQQRDPVIVAGRLRVCETGKRAYIEVEAWSVGPDLARTRADVLRTQLAA